MKRRSFIGTLLASAAAFFGLSRKSETHQLHEWELPPQVNPEIKTPFPNAVRLGGAWPPPGWQNLPVLGDDGHMHTYYTTTGTQNVGINPTWIGNAPQLITGGEVNPYLNETK